MLLKFAGDYLTEFPADSVQRCLRSRGKRTRFNRSDCVLRVLSRHANVAHPLPFHRRCRICSGPSRMLRGLRTRFYIRYTRKRPKHSWWTRGHDASPVQRRKQQLQLSKLSKGLTFRLCLSCRGLATPSAADEAPSRSGQLFAASTSGQVRPQEQCIKSPEGCQAITAKKTNYEATAERPVGG